LARVGILTSKGSLQQLPATPATATAPASPGGVSFVWVIGNEYIPENPGERIITDKGARHELELFFGNDGSSRALLLLDGVPLNNHIHVIAQSLGRSNTRPTDVTLFIPNPIAGEAGPICQGSFVHDFLELLEAVPASSNAPAKAWGIRASEDHLLEFLGNGYCDLHVSTVFRDDGTIEPAHPSVVCTLGYHGRYVAGPVTENKTMVMTLTGPGEGVAVFLHDDSPTAQGPRLVGVYDPRQVESDSASGSVKINEFYLLSDGRVLKLTRILRDDGRQAYLAAIDDHPLDNRRQELLLVGGRTAVLEQDAQPSAIGPFLKEIRDPYPVPWFRVELLGAR
jgi:hypothetical protein